MGQGAGLLLWRGQEEPGQDDRPGLQAAVQDQDLQAADRGGRGDRRPQPCQVQEGPAGAGGGGGACQARCSSLNLRKPTQPQNCSQLNLEKNLDRSANPLNPNNLVGTKVANQRTPDLPLTSTTFPLEELFGSSYCVPASTSLKIFVPTNRINLSATK